MECIEFNKTLKNMICRCVFDLQQVMFFEHIAGAPVSKGVSVRCWLIAVTAGKGFFLEGDSSRPLQKGSLVAMRPGTKFCISPGEGDALSYYAIGFMFTEGAASADAALSITDFAGCFCVTNTVKTGFLLKDLYRLSLGGNLHANPELVCAFYHFIAGLIEDFKEGPGNAAIHRRIEKVTDFIYENYNREITMEDLAKRCGISKEYFIRAFKEDTGMPPGRFVTNLRMNKAKELLLSGNHRVREVAALVGIRDEFYFSKLFKKTTEFRRSFMRKRPSIKNRRSI